MNINNNNGYEWKVNQIRKHEGMMESKVNNECYEMTEETRKTTKGVYKEY